MFRKNPGLVMIAFSLISMFAIGILMDGALNMWTPQMATNLVLLGLVLCTTLSARGMQRAFVLCPERWTLRH